MGLGRVGVTDGETFQKKCSRRALGIGSGNTRNNIRFLIFPDIWGEPYPMLMHMHHFLIVFVDWSIKLTQQLVVKLSKSSEIFSNKVYLIFQNYIKWKDTEKYF